MAHYQALVDAVNSAREKTLLLREVMRTRAAYKAGEKWTKEEIEAADKDAAETHKAIMENMT